MVVVYIPVVLVAIIHMQRSGECNGSVYINMYICVMVVLTIVIDASSNGANMTLCKCWWCM